MCLPFTEDNLSDKKNGINTNNLLGLNLKCLGMNRILNGVNFSGYNLILSSVFNV